MLFKGSVCAMMFPSSKLLAAHLELVTDSQRDLCAQNSCPESCCSDTRASANSGPVLLNIFINGLKTRLEDTISKLAGNTKLEEVLAKLENWTVTNHMNFNKSKCQIMKLGWSKPGHTHRLKDERLESSPTERVLGSLS